jgi:hypothetical protein
LQRLQTESDNIDKQYKTDIEDFIDTELEALSIVPVQDSIDKDSNRREEPDRILEDRYSKDLQKIILFLTILRKPSEISRREFCSFRKYILKYTVIRKELYCCRLKNIPSRIIVDSLEKRSAILKDLYKENRYKGRESMYWKIFVQYYWEGCYTDIKKYIASCKEY